jgi:hypothetical protein
MASRESFATTKRTASQARSLGRRGQAFAYPRLQDSSSRLVSDECSCPGAQQLPRQLAPKGNRTGCGSAMSSARCVGAKKGQAKNCSLLEFYPERTKMPIYFVTRKTARLEITCCECDQGSCAAPSPLLPAAPKEKNARPWSRLSFRFH